MAVFTVAARGQQLGELLSNVKKAATSKEKRKAYLQLIHYYKPLNVDSSSYYAEEGLKAALSQKDIEGEAVMIDELGKIDQAQGRMELSRQRMLYALDLYKSLNNIEAQAALINSLGAIEATLGNSEAAMPYFLSSLRIYDSIKTDQKGLMTADMNLGCLYLQNGDTVNSGKYFARAEVISKTLPVSDVTISLNNYIGVLYAVKGNLNKALEYFRRNVQLSDNPEFIPSHVEALTYLGSFYNDMGDTKTAMDYLQQGLKIALDKKLTESEADIELLIGTTLAKTDVNAGMEYVQKALATSEKMNSKTLKMDVYKTMAGIYEQKNDYKAANAALKQYEIIKDSVSRINKIKELASLGAVYELEKSNLKIDEVSRQRNVIISFSLVLVAALAAVAVLYARTKRLYIQLIKHEAELMELGNTKNKLFSIIGHDLRWPVARIPTILDIVDDETMSEEEKKYLIDSLREHTKATVETLDKLLYWGKSLMNGLQLVPEWFNPKQYILETIELRKMAAAEKEIRVIDHTPDDLEIYTDPNHFDFIIRNLFSNAIKFTPVKGIISFDVDVYSTPGFYVFSVTDTGIGIDADRMRKIFEPFNSKMGTANEKGTGIGLMLCKEFALKNGGDLWAKSQPGKGSTFYLSVRKTR